MSISKIPIIFALQIRFNTGQDAEFNTIYRVRSWRGVQPTVSAANLHALGEYVGQLCVHIPDAIRVQETFELED